MSAQIAWRHDQFHPTHGWGPFCSLCAKPENDPLHRLADALSEGTTRWTHADVMAAREWRT